MVAKLAANKNKVAVKKLKCCKLQCWSEIIETNAKNGVVFDATSNEQPI